ncbi:OmcA/MtrC family decaheme c-type cytochrome [Shewanella saliphila]|uniref:Surface localized decaheme cytochrome c lipoprotein n=1 Tax=Shewanella saliphila TaxID=2282698 RepID=A0ABQ2QB25_9GAMM|nr:OmcA/MtrC family decaheme c-type cytochrome [Shewanella saliphila]MCL1100051.1 OmcA/MtrC family decaheme c-type cytochrome [Shewanella saliphila]GGP62405.1 surface localized decaheme cytochrome c lipoprotein [Shewanella saliphila]
MRKYKKTLVATAFIAAFGLAGCGSDGSDGADGVDGVNGVDGVDGSDGTNATLSVTTVEDASLFTLTIAPTDIVVVGTDTFSVKFTVTGEGTGGSAVPFSGLETVALYATSQSENTTDTGAPYLWTNHTLANDFGNSMYCSSTGSATTITGAEVEACTLVEDPANPGTYTGTWEHDGTAPIVLTDGDANDLVRVMIRAYDVVDSEGTDVSDKVLSTPIDFIPATGELAVSAKDAVSNAACIKCHSPMEGYADTDLRMSNISAHHNYQKVENCVACHNPAYAGGQDDPEVGYNVNFNAMIHTIHMGDELADSLTGEALELFGEIAFPAEHNECAVCHDNGTQWNDNIYAEACESCHVDVNFETGEGHDGIVPASDAVCSGCHGAGSLSPMEAHSVNRRADLADGLVLDVVSAEVAAGELTVTIGVELNGAAPADGTDLADYLADASYAKAILIGTLDDNGDYVQGSSISTDSGMFVVTGGQIVLTQTLTDPTDLDGETLYVSSEMAMCGDTETDMIVATADGCDVGIPANIETKYFVFGDTAATGVETTDDLRFVNSTDYNAPTQVGNDRTTADEAKCNACHDNLAHIKSPRHGVTNFTQCADCHNNASPVGSHHETVQVEAEDGTFEVVEGLEYYNRDLATVSHRYHSGTYAEEASGVYINADGDLVNYPAEQTNCQACHKDANTAGDAMAFFDGTGTLTSGRTSVALGNGEYISPVTEACRSCHAHSGDAALAHFKSNGATVFGDNITSADAVPVESCATCHAEGKTYGVDVVHGSSAH